MKDSIAQRKQVTNPSESFVLERLNGIPNVSQALAVNEENDVNGIIKLVDILLRFSLHQI